MKFASLKARFFFISILLIVIMTAGGLSWYLLKDRSIIRGIILISIDTCRADHLSCYGFARPTTPQIDEIAREGIVFKNAHTPIPQTLPAHCSMLTGTYPIYHQVHENREHKLDDSLVTLAEILQEQGYFTGGIISSFVLDRQFGISQGFEIYQDKFEQPLGIGESFERRGAEASRFAEAFLDEHSNNPFFLFLHYFDPHDAYQPPEPFSWQYADDLYSGEIAYTDQCLRQVIDKLKELDLYDSTLIMIVGDHGEGLGEHGEAIHGYYIYQSTIHVPFIMRPPGITRPMEVDQTVSLVDVVPTILGCLDIPIPEHIQGKDLSFYLQKPESSDSHRQVYTESLTPTKYGCNPLLGVIGDNWSYIHANRPELYDLNQDRRQLNNLADKEPQQVRLMESQLHQQMVLLVGAPSVDSRLEFDAESRKRLESMGYVGSSSVDKSMTLDPAKKDAKDMILYNEHHQQANLLLKTSKFAEARQLCQKLKQLGPEICDSYSVLMRIAWEEKNWDELLNQGRDYLVAWDKSHSAVGAGENNIPVKNLSIAYTLMAQAASELKKFDLVEKYCTEYLRLNPQASITPAVHNVLARAYFGQGRKEQAFKLWGEIIRDNPEMAEAYVEMGTAYYQAEDYNRAINNFNEALRLKPNWAPVRQKLNAALKMKQLDQSILQITELLRRNPDNHQLHDQLANYLYDKGRYYQAIEHGRQAIRLKPDWPIAYNNLAWMLATIPEQELHNPAEAVRLALRAAELTENKNAYILDTLSTAYAAADKYDEAINTAQKALSLALSEGNDDLAQKLRQNLILYKSKRDGQAENTENSPQNDSQGWFN